MIINRFGIHQLLYQVTGFPDIPMPTRIARAYDPKKRLTIEWVYWTNPSTLWVLRVIMPAPFRRKDDLRYCVDQKDDLRYCINRDDGCSRRYFVTLLRQAPPMEPMVLHHISPVFLDRALEALSAG